MRKESKKIAYNITNKFLFSEKIFIITKLVNNQNFFDKSIKKTMTRTSVALNLNTFRKKSFLLTINYYKNINALLNSYKKIIDACEIQQLNNTSKQIIKNILPVYIKINNLIFLNYLVFNQIFDSFKLILTIKKAMPIIFVLTTIKKLCTQA